MQNEQIIEAVFEMCNKEETPILKLKIEALINEILSYLNRSEIEDYMFASVVSTISDCLKVDFFNGAKVQSYSEGDISVSYANLLPFFGRLDSYKLISGVKDVQEWLFNC